MTSPTPSPSELTRAQLYERIRSSSKEEVVLTEMQRLGFWPADSGKPSVESALIRRETELTQALQKLGGELHHLQNPEAALRMLRKERMAKAKARREETRQKRALVRFEKAQAWRQRREHEVLYLGAGVSGGLSRADSDAGKLAGLAMPVLHKADELAQAMGITLSELRFLAFERRVSRISHYRRFAMPKKTGGERIISAPMPRLKRAQYWVLDNVLARAPLHQAAHGFVPGRSIVSNAAPHVGQAVVINLDLKDFFPSIGMPRIKGVFAQLGYSEQLATILALLCTEAPTDEVRIDGETFFVAHGPRALPQGAPSSPALTNILCRRLDARLQACAATLGFKYTRYADDLTFSGDADARKLAGKLLWRAKQIVIDEGFTPHPDKQHVMHDAQRQMVTGIVVNRKPSLERETLRRFRATLFQLEKDGPEGKQWNGNTNVIDALEGYAQFIRMVDPVKGLPLLVRVRAARARWGAAGIDMKLMQSKRSSAFRALSAQGKAPWDGWWQATLASAPVLEKTAAQLAVEKKERKAAEAPAVPPAPVNMKKPAAAQTPVAAPAAAVRPPPASDAPANPDPVAKPDGDNNFQVAIAVQVALICAFALASQRVLPSICMAVIVLQSAMLRKPRWGWFLFIILIWSAVTLKW
ncbi:reverse transcriptase family protein [Massilia pseudoviolaceinigra]|uniref:reverse transcriptase family protein n=1 Tax=Massilia pseudoviolaceinigra TaxID=3057165 RepID=UPI0027968869|nr:reverse transcriptase family protein [Massilia sp. CCM 9206]MDQ1925036.1 reverse transcriptase family protein [Massilia sp. CCM 9206]